MTSLINTLYNRAREGDSDAQKELFEQLYVRFRLFVHHKVKDKSAAEDLVQ